MRVRKNGERERKNAELTDFRQITNTNYFRCFSQSGLSRLSLLCCCFCTKKIGAHTQRNSIHLFTSFEHCTDTHTAYTALICNFRVKLCFYFLTISFQFRNKNHTNKIPKRKQFFLLHTARDAHDVEIETHTRM